jgi:hypothetical protein
MFKLIKIVNSGVNVPEPIRMPKASETVIKAGTLLTVNGGLLKNCTATATPTYVALADSPAGATEAVVAEINRNMYFEAPVTAEPDALAVGDKVTLAIDSDGAAYGVTATTSSGVATVVELAGANASGDKITVKF